MSSESERKMRTPPLPKTGTPTERTQSQSPVIAEWLKNLEKTQMSTNIERTQQPPNLDSLIVNLSMEEEKLPVAFTSGSNAARVKKPIPTGSEMKSSKSEKRSKHSSEQPAAVTPGKQTPIEKSTSKESSFYYEEKKITCPTYEPVKYNTDTLPKLLEDIIEKNKKNSLLEVAAHAIRFLPTDTMESCYHLDMYNPTKESSPVSYLSVKPKIGYVAPGEARTVYLLFSFRCPRLPDDLAFGYTIHQATTKASNLPELEADRKSYTTKRTRQIARYAKFNRQWIVPVAFWDEEMAAMETGSGTPVKYTCPGHHFEGNPPQLDNHGKIYEDRYDPEESDENDENLPSAED